MPHARALIRQSRRVAVSVPLQLIPISGSDRNFYAHRSNPLYVWLRGAFLSVINYSALANGDTCRVTNKTHLNPYASMLTEVFQGATDSHAVTHDTIFPTRLKPYGIRLQGRSAGVSNYSMLCDQVTPEKQRVERSSACCFDCVTVTELPDLLPRRPQASGEAVPESGKSGQAPVSEKAEGDKRPSEKPLLILTLTEEQLNDLAFAVYCQTSEIQDGDEADHSEVVPVIRRLNEISAMCIELKKRVLS